MRKLIVWLILSHYLVFLTLTFLFQRWEQTFPELQESLGTIFFWRRCNLSSNKMVFFFLHTWCTILLHSKDCQITKGFFQQNDHHIYTYHKCLHALRNMWFQKGPTCIPLWYTDQVIIYMHAPYSLDTHHLLDPNHRAEAGLKFSSK